MPDERAISEVLGYVVVFSLVITSILLVTGAFSVIQDVRDSEREKNAARAFDVTAENMAAIYERDAPSRATEIDLGDSSIFYANNVSITVRGDGTELASYRIRPVEMQVTDEQSLVYEGGAVFRDQPDADVMLREPPFLLTNDRVNIPIVQTIAPEIQSVGSTTVLLRGERTDRSVIESDTSSSYSQLTIEVASPRYEGWETHFEQNPALDCTTDPVLETVECTIDDPDTVYVVHHQIALSLIR
jgi:hypothetical protein